MKGNCVLKLSKSYQTSRISFVMSLFIALSFSPVISADTFLINMPYPLKGTKEAANIQTFFSNVYQELNINPQFVYSSVGRSFKLMDSGDIQAEAYRTHEITEPLSSTYKIDLPLTKVKVGLFCSSKENCDISASSVYAIQKDFGYGKIICEELSIECKTVSSAKALAKVVDEGMADAVISPYPAYKAYLCQAKAKQFVYKELPEFQFSIYHFNSSSDKTFRAKLKLSLSKWLDKESSPFDVYSDNPTLRHCNKQLVEASNKFI